MGKGNAFMTVSAANRMIKDTALEHRIIYDDSPSAEMKSSLTDIRCRIEGIMELAGKVAGKVSNSKRSGERPSGSADRCMKAVSATVAVIRICYLIMREMTSNFEYARFEDFSKFEFESTEALKKWIESIFVEITEILKKEQFTDDNEFSYTSKIIGTFTIDTTMSIGANYNTIETCLKVSKVFEMFYKFAFAILKIKELEERNQLDSSDPSYLSD